jgi:hypothetical protein
MNSTIIILILAAALLVAIRVIAIDDCVATESVKVMFHRGEV